MSLFSIIIIMQQFLKSQNSQKTSNILHMVKKQIQQPKHLFIHYPMIRPAALYSSHHRYMPYTTPMDAWLLKKYCVCSRYCVCQSVQDTTLDHYYNGTRQFECTLFVKHMYVCTTIFSNLYVFIRCMYFGIREPKNSLTGYNCL